jgi:diguanylate cyclase (GGDEF)-like protein/PAS domain S-box-containing protein
MQWHVVSARDGHPVRSASPAEEALRVTLDRIQRQLQAIGAADQIRALTTGDVEAAARDITALAARVAGCERVNLWLFNDDESELRCIESYEATPARHSSGARLRRVDFEVEFEALRHARYVNADDPLTDPRTAGYVETYVKPLGITSMLDAVVQASGRNLGVLCFEHVGRPHRWERDEIAFACHLADKLGLALLVRERLQSEARLREREAALADAQAIAHVGSWEFDIARRVLTWSDETYRIFGVARGRFVPSYEAFLARVHPDDRAAVDRNYTESVATHGLHALDHRIVLDDGSVRFVQERGRTVYEGGGRPLRSIGTVQDITDQKRTEAQLRFANTLLATQMETSPDGILVVDPQGQIQSMNQRFADMWNLPVGLRHAGDDAPLLAAVTSGMKDGETFLARVRHLYAHPEEDGHDELETKDGRCIDRHTAVLRTADGEALGRVWFFRDITDRKRSEAEMLYIARHDGLTGLPNRGVFVEALQLAIGHARRTEARLAVLYLDLDHFKDVNDTLGHPVGDALLQLVAARLRSRAREMDTIARFGGDEFAVVAEGLDTPADAAAVADALIQALNEPFAIAGNEVRTGVSVGIAIYGPESVDAETLLSQADVALYRAKSEGRGTYRFFTEAMDTEVRTRVTLGAELREAIASDQLVLLYQPQVAIDSGRITGVEALVRWRHPTRGLIGPDVFIPVAEESGLIRALGQHVLREACRQARAWLDAGLGLDRLAVNLSSVQVRMPLELERETSEILADTGLPPDRLELELTETVLMVASQEQSAVLGRFQARGITIAIDDFGTGYSSLNYLNRFPVDRIKLAQDFVGRIATDAGSAAIVKATIGLAREMGIAVIAEGVETEDQLARLTEWGCGEAQGFHLAPPLAAREVTALLRRGAVPRPRTVNS